MKIGINEDGFDWNRFFPSSEISQFDEWMCRCWKNKILN